MHTSSNSLVTPNFTFHEVSCRHCGEMYADDLFWYHMNKLQALRGEVGPLTKTSGHRCGEHNAAQGGAKKSMHLKIASDLQPASVSLDELYEAAKAAGFTGLGRYNTFLHVDCRDFIDRPPAEWDRRR